MILLNWSGIFIFENCRREFFIISEKNPARKLTAQCGHQVVTKRPLTMKVLGFSKKICLHGGLYRLISLTEKIERKNWISRGMSVASSTEHEAFRRQLTFQRNRQWWCSRGWMTFRIIFRILFKYTRYNFVENFGKASIDRRREVAASHSSRSEDTVQNE